MPHWHPPPHRHVHILGSQSHNTFLVNQYLANRAIGGRVRFEGGVSLKLCAIERSNPALESCVSVVLGDIGGSIGATHIVIASPEELLRRIKCHGRNRSGKRVHARRRKLDPGDLGRARPSACLLRMYILSRPRKPARKDDLSLRSEAGRIAVGQTYLIPITVHCGRISTFSKSA